MFKDYYLILEISQTATQEEIKIAYKSQAIKWHPDKNIGIDTTLKMQDINEAYLILKDNEARARFDIEYAKFKKHHKEHNSNKEKFEKEKEDKKASSESWSYDYEVEDETLEKWIRNARRQAVDLARQTLEDILDLSIRSTKEAGKVIFEQTLIYGTISIILYFLFMYCS